MAAPFMKPRSLLLSVLLLFGAFFPAHAQEGEGRSDSAVFKARSDSVWKYVRQDVDSALQLGMKNLRFAERIEDRHLIKVANGDLATVHLAKGEYDKALQRSKTVKRIDRDKGNKESVAGDHKNIGLIYSRQGKTDSALKHYRKSIRLLKELEDPLREASIYNSIGNLYKSRSNYPKALRYYQKGLDALDEIKEKENKVRKRKVLLQANLGSVQERRDSYEKALEAYGNALEIFEEMEDLTNQGNIQLSLGDIYKERGDSSRALRELRKALQLFQRVGSPRAIARAHNGIGGVLRGLGRDAEAEDHLLKADSIAQEIGVIGVEGSVSYDLAALHLKKGNPRKALEYARNGYDIAERSGDLDLKKNNSEILYRIHQAQGRYQQAVEYLEEVRALEDSIMNEERAKKLTRMEMSYRFDKERMRDSLQHQKEIEVHEAELEQERMLRYGILGGSGILLLLLGVIFDRFRVARKRKAVIQEQKEEVDRAYDELHEKNAELEDSINYASRIQSAILTSDDQFHRILPEHFIFFRPKEMVSGDFYWAYGDDRYAIWLAADCTGHGVPGAFMSMIGNRLFNEVVVEQGERDPGTIFERVRSGIIEALEQGDEEETSDGMDAALCVLDRKTMELSFAGAQNPLYILQSAEEDTLEGDKVLEEQGYRLIEIKGDSSPIGRDPYKKGVFRTVSLQLRGGETLYTFSDGFADQFGGSKGKKYRYKPFKQLLLSIQDHSMEEQKKTLEQAFLEWMGDREQVDDVVLIGVRPQLG